MESDFPKIEKEILKFWQKEKIFEKSLERTKKKPRFVFFEGPPFANGLPGIHHLLARAFKDIILRYKTMQGFYVERKAGWDTHGLPTEMSAEKNLNIKSKKDIENNINKFIAECQNNVFTYKKEWEEFTERIGYWLDLKNAYITCSNEYIESLWCILKQAWDKNLLYQDYKVVPFCPRCGTSLSSHEVAQGYKTVKENSIYIKFKITEQKSAAKKGDYFLVWTTTPWTLPANVALAVNEKLDYVRIKTNNEFYVLAKECLGVIKEGFEVKSTISGGNLVGMEYEPLFNFTKPDKKAYFVVSGNFVSAEDGTGIVHMAPAFGEEDMEAGKANNLPVILNVDREGKFKAEVKPWAGRFVKDADPLITADLEKRDLLFREEMYEHEYPFCWRCNSPLLYYAKESWFIKMTAIKKKLIENNKKINWVPSYLKEGRFGEWLEEVKDWNLSRERYWGTPLPIWQCEKCREKICIGSTKELREKTGKAFKLKGLHRPQIDEVALKCQCGGKMKRVKEVIDCWFDSGSMPFAQWHYPFENKDLIDKGKFFPADFICEGIDQTRGWFYTLLAVSTLLDKGVPYKNVISIGIVLDEKGQKMSKSKGNIVKPEDIIDKYGADVARFYFYTVNAVADPKNFNFEDVQSLYRRFFDTLINAKKFFDTYAGENFKKKNEFSPGNLLDKWIVSCVEELNAEIVERLDEYDVVGAARLFDVFVDDLSNWYVRRSRKRFQGQGKEEAAQTLYYILLKTSKLLAPFTPFLSEYIYKDLKKKEKSVHLEDYPLPENKLIDKEIKGKMSKVREIVSAGLKERAMLGIKVRQPLASFQIPSSEKQIPIQLVDLIREEVNVKEVIFGNVAKLDAKMTAELKEEGISREVMRTIQAMRKKAGLKPEDKISVFYSGDKEIARILQKNKKQIISETRLNNLTEKEKSDDFGIKKEIKIENKELWLAIEKV